MRSSLAILGQFLEILKTLEDKKPIRIFLLDLAEDMPSADTEGPFGPFTQKTCGWGAKEALIVRYIQPHSTFAVSVQKRLRSFLATH